MIKPATALMAMALGLAVWGPAAAAPPVQPDRPAAQPAPDPRAAALIRRYLAAIHFERMMDNMQASMLPLFAEQATREHPDLTAEDQQIIVDIVRRAMREKFTPMMIERMIPIYTETFTLPELEAMVAFYESPVGRSITDKAGTLAPKSAALTREMMPVLQAEVLRQVVAEFCKRKGCPATPQPKTRPS